MFQRILDMVINKNGDMSLYSGACLATERNFNSSGRTYVYQNMLLNSQLTYKERKKEGGGGDEQLVA